MLDYKLILQTIYFNHQILIIKWSIYSKRQYRDNQQMKMRKILHEEI
jgi:hypothetical protein